MQAISEMDLVMGMDIHIVLVPAPPSPPIPTPLPHPFVGFVFNPLDWIPFFNKVKVSGFPAASVTSGASPCPPLHIPMPPGLPGVWAKGKVGDDAMMLMGGLTVKANDKCLTFAGLPVLSCSCIGAPPAKPPDPKKMTAKQKLAAALGYLPTSVVTPIPKGNPVIVGCPPTIDVLALAFAFAFKAALTLGGHFFRHWQQNSAAWARFSNWLQQKTGSRNWLNRFICFLTGHPVDIATGKVFTDHTDFEIPGPIALKWTRVWYSTSAYNGPLGHGWHHNYDMALWYDRVENSLFIRLEDGREIQYPELEHGELHYNRQEKLLLRRDGKDYILRDSQNLYYRFKAPFGRTATEQKIVAIENAAGFSIQFHYSQNGHLKEITDSAGRTISLKSDHEGKILQVDAPHPEKPGETFPIVSYRYDHRGNLAESLDALGKPFNYSYNKHLLVKETNRNGLNFYFEYDGEDENAWCTRTWGDNGIYDHKLTYDKTDRWTIVENSLGHKTKYFWNEFGIVYKTVDPLGNEKVYRYGSFVQTLMERDELGQATYHDYDEWGNRIRTTYPDGSKVEKVYEDGLLIAQTDQNGGTWQWTYNEQRQITSRIDPLGRTTKYHYKNGLLDGITDPAGGTIRLEYDKFFNISKLVLPNGTTSKWTYDRMGRCIEAMDARTNIQKRKFNFNGWVRTVNEPDGNHREIEYDGEGNVLRATDNHHDVRFEYAGMNRIKSRTEAGTRVEFKYDTEDNLLGIINEHGYAYRFNLDKNGKVVSESGFDGLTRRYARDAAGRVTKVLRPNGTTTHYEYDPMSRVIAVDYENGAFEKYAYRPDGELMEAANQYITVKFDRDKLGRVTKESQGGLEVESRYDVLGMRTHLTSTLGANITFQRNMMGDVEAITSAGDNMPWEAAFQRDQFGLELERQLPGGVRSQWKRDRLGRPVEQKTFATGGKLSRERQYVWDVNDRLKQITDPEEGAWLFEHDAFGNLAAAKYPDGTSELRMPDAVGNLFKTKDRKDRQYGPAGQLLEANGTRYEYDAEGNLTKKTERNGAVWHYEWNAAGMLQRVVRPDGDTVTFTYDALGRRISKSYREKTTRWVWDGNLMLHEWEEISRQSSVRSPQSGENIETGSLIKIRRRDEQIVASTSHAPTAVAKTGLQTDDWRPQTDITTWLFEPETFSPLAKLVNGKQYGIVTDHLGTPVGMYSRTGEKVWEMDLSIYGAVRNMEGWREACPFRYPGQYEDVETGLYYNRFRYYDGEMGGYLSQDPIRLDGGRQFYSYVKDVNTWLDEYGLAPHGHHSDPKFLGGNHSQSLTTLDEVTHRALHNDMNNYLENIIDPSTGRSMRPKRGNSGAIIRATFSRSQRLSALADFYSSHGHLYPTAATDFFNQHPHLRPLGCPY